jgi:hypothetical protein
MKKYIVIVLSLIITTGAYAQGYQNLFNGKDLAGWTIHGTEKWYVDAGELVCESGPDKAYGYLSTNKAYKNFILDLKFKQEADGNSGVFIRSDIDGVKIKGWQIEVAPLNLHTGGIYESYGRGWLIKPDPKDEVMLKVGEWNQLRIKAQDGKITTWLNGKQMVNIDDEKIGAANGFVALQIHDGGGIKVRWKDIKIKKI